MHCRDGTGHAIGGEKPQPVSKEKDRKQRPEIGRDREADERQKGQNVIEGRVLLQCGKQAERYADDHGQHDRSGHELDTAGDVLYKHLDNRLGREEGLSEVALQDL